MGPRLLLGWTLMLAACVASVEVRQSRYVDRVDIAADGTIEVYSRRGIGSLEVTPAAPPPTRICFSYASGRPFSKLEGLEVVAIGSGGERQDVEADVAGGCATVTGAPGGTTLRIQFVDFYR